MRGLVAAVRERFDKIQDPAENRRFNLSDLLMSGLAVFALK